MSGVRNPNTDDWSEERYAEAARLKREGLSAAEIAKKIGGTTRNAVIAKIWRMEPDKRDRTRSAAKSTSPAQKAKAQQIFHSPPELLAVRRFSWEETQP